MNSDQICELCKSKSITKEGCCVHNINKKFPKTNNNISQN